MIAQALVARGHKVVILTHAYGRRVGIRYLTRGIKVYYVPYAVVARQDALPNFFGLLPLFRTVILREKIEIVHAHQALSSMGLESLLHAACMGLKTVFTDHSLFGMDNAASILTSKLLRFLLAGVGHVVTVSHVGKENTALRAQLEPARVSVIPNAVVASQFLPSHSPTRTVEGVTIVVLSRLMYRKGTDLLEAAIPRICAAHATVRFVIGGDGPNRVGLEQMRERHELQHRVELVGSVPSTHVPAHLQRGHILLNTSLTEAFGTGLIEGAAAGLLVVSTRVGGVQEVLPPDLVLLAEADEDDVVHTALQAVYRIERGDHNPLLAHARIQEMYSWAEVARRLERVYNHLPAPPDRGTLLLRYRAAGHAWIGGVVFVIVAAVDMVLLALLNWVFPRHEVDYAPDFGPYIV